MEKTRPLNIAFNSECQISFLSLVPFSSYQWLNMDPKKIARINELAKKKKTVGLTGPEKVEQAKLREEYIEGYRRSVRHHIEGIKLVDEEGNDVTPEKLRQVQREKGLHGRSLEDPKS